MSEEKENNRYTKKGLRSRQLIIDVAMNMIRTRGYTETTIQDICTEVGIAIGTFYHYFRSKEEVLLAFIDAENEDLLKFYNQQEKTSYSRVILAVADYYINMYLFKGVSLVSHIYSMMLFSTIEIGKLTEYAFMQIMQEAFINGQQTGEFSQEISVETFCNMAVGEWFFFTSLWCNKSDSFKIREMVTENFTQLLRLVSAEKTV